MHLRRRVCLFSLFVLTPLAEVRLGFGQEAVRLHHRIDSAIATAHVGSLAEVADDFEFLRRVYLNLVGRSPSIQEIRAFVGCSASGKRATTIDKLLASEEFDDYFTDVLDVMFMERRGGSRISQDEWHSFLHTAVKENWPFDRIVQTILAADGTGELRGAVKFLVQREVEPNALTRDIGRIFMGRDLQCAQCHDHPNITDYEQSEYYGILAFVNRSYLFEDEADNKKSYVGEKAEGKTEFKSVFMPDEDTSRTIPTLLSGLTLEVEPRFEGQDAYVVAPSKTSAGIPKFSRRAQLARLVTHPSNQHFSKNAVNRFWAHMMGRGFVEPVDFHHSDNLPTHPALLKTLADEFVRMKFDIRDLLREIALSRTYQRSIDFPVEATVQMQEVNDRVNELNFAIQENGASNDRELAELIGRLATRRAKLAQVDASITESAQRIEEFKQEQVSISKSQSNLQKKLEAQQAQLELLKDAASAAKKVAESLPKDVQLAAQHATYQRRSDELSTAIDATQEQLTEQDSQAKSCTGQRKFEKLRLAQLRAHRVGVADMVAEARGAVFVIQARRDRRDTQLLEIQQQLAAVTLHQEYLAKLQSQEQLEARCSELTAGTDGTGSEQQTVAQAITTADERASEPEQQLSAATADWDAAMSQTELASQRLRDLWVRRFAVRALVPLSPEQLAASTISIFELGTRYQSEAESEWQKKHEDNEPDEIDESSKAREVAELLEKRIDKVVSTYVSMFAAPGGSPQDVFSATADQALFLANDGRVQGWLSSAKGGLLRRLQAVDDLGALADEMHLAILSRPASDEEKKETETYLTSRKDDRNAAIREVAWGLLSSLEFRFNH